MTSPARWSLSVAAIALIATAGFAFVGSSVSQTAHEGTERGATTARVATPVVPPRAPSAVAAAVDPVDGAARVTRGRRQSAMEAALRPLLVEPRLRAGVFGLDMRSGAFFDLSGDQAFSAASLIKIPV